MPSGLSWEGIFTNGLPSRKSLVGDGGRGKGSLEEKAQAWGPFYISQTGSLGSCFFPPWSSRLVLDPRESPQRGHSFAPLTLCGSVREHSSCSSWKAKDQGANPEDGDRFVREEIGEASQRDAGCPRSGKRARGQGWAGECTAHQQRLLSPS